jgi:beta-galactosidase
VSSAAWAWGAFAATGAGLDAASASTAPGSAAKAVGPRVTYQNKRILIDGKPVLVLAGEIHYFRLKCEDWQDRLDKAKAAGLNTIANYIPWMWHELPDGSLDVTGRTRPERVPGVRGPRRLPRHHPQPH